MIFSNVSKLVSLLALTGLAALGCASPNDAEHVSDAKSEMAYVQGTGCVTLQAGQTIDAGTVCTAVVGSDLVVSYSTKDGWELTEAHLWVGDNLANMPQTAGGNPKIGNFPYNSGSITGATSYSFSVPLASLGGEPAICDHTFFVAAHAALQKANGDGTYQKQTGWGDGTRFVQRGSWATYFSITFGCEEPPPPPVEQTCETAFAFGNETFIDLGITDSRWGWEAGPLAPGSYTEPLYAGAGQNDITKGANVGTVSYVYDGSTVTVAYSMSSGYTMDEAHLYVGATPVSTIAPGQFGNTHNLDGASSDSFTVGGFSGQPVYIVAHAVVCH